jgi:SAM-dependent methyltransferase
MEPDSPAPITGKAFWDGFFDGIPLRHVEDVLFSDIFRQYLRPDPSQSVLEIGCAGGLFLAYLTRKFGYEPHGIDYSDAIEHTRALFRFNTLAEPHLTQADFFSWEPGRKFDVVCSFGFVEHFRNPGEVVRRHCDLLAPGGTLIITVPNFRLVQYVYHRLIEPDILALHNLKVMRPAFFRSALADTPLEIRHLAYYGTFAFWTSKAAPTRLDRAAIRYFIRPSGRAIRSLFRYRPNALISPHVVCVAALPGES